MKIKFIKKTKPVIYILSIFSSISIVITTLIGNILGQKIVLEFEDNKPKLELEYTDDIFIKNSDQLTKALNYKTVTKADVIKVINENDKISDFYKKHIIIFLEYMNEKYPNTDMRIFYENMKTLEIEIINNENTKTISASYSTVNNKITIDEEKALTWLSNGAQPTDTVKNILSHAGIMAKFAESKKKSK